MKRHVILAALDGTGSSDWRRPDGLNSHIYRFFRDLSAERQLKKELHGPNLMGYGMDANIQTVFGWILSRMQDLVRAGTCTQEEIQVCLVGHSRGCVAAVKVANMLADRTLMQTGGKIRAPITVHFMGLYDAVDRWTGSADTTLRNVTHCYHAARQNISVFASRGSRGTFGSVRVVRAIEQGHQQSFNTSHGGIGGDPGFFTRLGGIGDDFHCNSLEVVLTAEELLRDYGSSSQGPHRGPRPRYQPLEGEAKRARIGALREFLQASRDADRFIREGARSAGLHFNGASEHIPCLEKQADLWNRLQRVLTTGDHAPAAHMA